MRRDYDLEVLTVAQAVRLQKRLDRREAGAIPPRRETQTPESPEPPRHPTLRPGAPSHTSQRQRSLGPRRPAPREAARKAAEEAARLARGDTESDLEDDPLAAVQPLPPPAAAPFQAPAWCPVDPPPAAPAAPVPAPGAGVGLQDSEEEDIFGVGAGGFGLSDEEL